MASLALVVMHHCHRNLLGLLLDGPVEIDVIAGEDAVFDFRLGNDTAVERCDIEIHCAVSAGSAMVGSTRVNVPAKGYCQAAVAWPVAARGVLRIERVELRTRYPIGWFRAWSYAHTALTAYVAPRPWGDRPLAAQAAAVGNAAESPMRGDEEFAGLRNYEAGVPLKHMAWKVLARGGAPAVRIYSGLAAQPQWLEWGSLEPLDVETRLAQLCRWVLACDAARRAYGLRIPGTEIAPSLGETHRAACLRALALYPVEPGA